MQNYVTPHGNFEAGDIIWHVGPHGTRTRAGTIRDVGPAFAVTFHDTPGVHLVPSAEVRHPGCSRPLPKATRPRPLLDPEFIVSLMTSDGPMPASFPKVHRTREAARKEAARLSSRSLRKLFGVYALVDVYATDVDATLHHRGDA